MNAEGSNCMNNIRVLSFQFQMLPTGEKEREGSSLVLPNVTRLESGTYICRASNGVDRPVEAKIELHVICEYQGNMTQHPIHGLRFVWDHSTHSRTEEMTLKHSSTKFLAFMDTKKDFNMDLRRLPKQASFCVPHVFPEDHVFIMQVIELGTIPITFITFGPLNIEGKVGQIP